MFRRRNEPNEMVEFFRNSLHIPSDTKNRNIDLQKSIRWNCIYYTSTIFVAGVMQTFKLETVIKLVRYVTFLLQTEP